METFIISAVSLFIGFFLGAAASYKRYKRERKKAGEDYLTKVFNYREFEQKIGEIIKLGKGYNAAILLDLDRFKEVNDRFGYAAGDEVLKQFAEIIDRQVRTSDLVFRFKNGDEFVVLFRNLPVNSFAKVGERLRESVETTPFKSGQDQVNLTVSIGLTTLKGNDTKETLIERLEKGLKIAKEEENKVLAL